MRLIDLFAPSRPANHRVAAAGIATLLALSALALLGAPALMPVGYSWVEHTTSESAAQGVEGAWLARLGFVLFGLAVLWLAAALSTVWARAAAWLHVSFGVLMVCAAAFSTRPWVESAAFDPIEDLLHTIAATTMGFSFSLGVLACLFQRGMEHRTGRTFDAVAIATATGIPLAMTVLPGVEGLLQRLIFLVAFLWYGSESRRIPWAKRGGAL